MLKYTKTKNYVKREIMYGNYNTNTREAYLCITDIDYPYNVKKSITILNKEDEYLQGVTFDTIKQIIDNED